MVEGTLHEGRQVRRVEGTPPHTDGSSTLAEQADDVHIKEERGTGAYEVWRDSEGFADEGRQARSRSPKVFVCIGTYQLK